MEFTVEKGPRRRDASQRQQMWGGGEMLSSTTAGGGQLETLANPTYAHPRIRYAQKRGLDMPLTTVGPTQMRETTIDHWS